jgi:hypothetical protein
LGVPGKGSANEALGKPTSARVKNAKDDFIGESPEVKRLIKTIIG